MLVVSLLYNSQFSVKLRIVRLNNIGNVNKILFLQELKVNYTSPEPRFAVSNLEAGHAYIVSVYAFNGKGRSDPTMLQTAMLRLPEKQLTSEKGEVSFRQFLHNYVFIIFHSLGYLSGTVVQLSVLFFCVPRLFTEICCRDDV